MNEHTHTTHVEGCYRCDLSRDEAAAQEKQDTVILGELMRSLVESKAAQLSPPYGDRAHWTLLLDSAARPKLTFDQYDALSNILTIEDLDRLIALENQSPQEDP